MTRRKRKLTEDERTLWHKVASSARPLNGKTGRQIELPVKAGSTHPQDMVKPGQTRSHRSATESHPASHKQNNNAAESTAGSAVNHLDRRSSRLLGRGRVRIDARLDLHGMTQDAAHFALQGFLHRCRQNGIRYVLVITGKSGVLNRMVPLWMAEPSLRDHVSGVTTAGARHGGHGALYIRLRRHG